MAANGIDKKDDGRNGRAWEAFFEKHRVLERLQTQESVVVSAVDMKEFREPRLMAKFDHRVNLPRIFADNRLAILPVTRGEYVISHFEAYHDFEPAAGAVTRKRLPGGLRSLTPDRIPSETRAINCAYASGMLQDFMGEDTLYPTVAGRMGSGHFDFTIHSLLGQTVTPVTVDNSQIEIDAAFEGAESLALIEAKKDLSEDFLVRQLYYPFRTWRERVPKKVCPVFLVYSNGIFYFYEYEFEDPYCYNSLALRRQKNYVLEETRIRREDLQGVLHHTAAVREPEIPFPQADRFGRVINLCELLEAGEMDREQVTDEYDFDVRQTNYYTDAARYLGLLEKKKEGRRPVYALSSRGRAVMERPYRDRQLALCECILEHEVFREVFLLCLEDGAVPPRPVIVERMKRHRLYRVGSDSTYGRRSLTISGWMHWMLGLTQSKKDE